MSHTAKSFFDRASVDKNFALNNAYDAGTFTVPTLYRREAGYSGSGRTQGVQIEQSYQSIGARGVQNLSSKLLLTILPPGGQWVRLDVNEHALDRELLALGLQPDQTRRVKTEFESGLTSITNEIHRFVDSTPSIRVRAHELIRDLVVGGSAIWRIDDDGQGRVFHLPEIATQRGQTGNLVAFCVREKLYRAEADDRVLALMKDKEEWADVYTLVELEPGGVWKVRQEIHDKVVPNTEGTYTAATFPFIDGLFEHIGGEHYGRSYVEFLIGDLRSADGLSQAVVEGAAAAARLIPLVNPNSTVKPSQLSKTRNGEPILGEANDVTFLTVNKVGDFSFALNALARIEQRLELAFLMNTGIQRNGERVTATEINALVQELTDTLGGVYSHLAASIQVPLVNRILSVMRAQNLVPQLPMKLIRPSVVAGLENVGRGRELQGLSVALSTAQSLVGPEPIIAQINANELLRRSLIDAGVEPRGLLKTEEQIQAEQAEAQRVEAARAVGPELVRGVMDAPQPTRGEPQ